jgi:hypothetical protein
MEQVRWRLSFLRESGTADKEWKKMLKKFSIALDSSSRFTFTLWELCGIWIVLLKIDESMCEQNCSSRFWAMNFLGWKEIFQPTEFG